MSSMHARAVLPANRLTTSCRDWHSWLSHKAGQTSEAAGRDLQQRSGAGRCAAPHPVSGLVPRCAAPAPRQQLPQRRVQRAAGAVRAAASAAAAAAAEVAGRRCGARPGFVIAVSVFIFAAVFLALGVGVGASLCKAAAGGGLCRKPRAAQRLPGGGAGRAVVATEAALAGGAPSVTAARAGGARTGGACGACAGPLGGLAAAAGVVPLQPRAAGALVALELGERMEAGALLAEALHDALVDDAGHPEMILADLVALVVVPQLAQVRGAAVHLQRIRSDIG